jgi:alpha-L-rhamnosidase
MMADYSSKSTMSLGCLGLRLTEGWFTGRIGFRGERRNIWGPHTAILAQLEAA